MGGLSADVVVKNGKIVTVDPGFRVVEALAIFGGRIVEVGTAEDVAPLVGRRTQVIDLGGRTTVPGIIDNHTHQLVAGLATLGAKLQVGYLKSIAEIALAVGRRASETPEGDWIVTTGLYRGVLAEGRFPNRWDLDPVTPRHPVYLQQSGKNFILNSYAMRLAGITKETPDPTGFPEGHIVRRDDGEPTGHFIAGAGDMVRKRLWKVLGMPAQMWDFYVFPVETKAAAIEAQMKFYNSCGLTGTRDMGVSPQEVEAYQLVRNREGMTLRTNLVLGIPARYIEIDEIVAALDKYFGPKQRFGDEWLRVGGLKVVVQNDGWWALGPDKLRTIVLEANRRHWTLAIHMTTGGGDDAIDTCLQILEEADRERPLAGRRFTVEHGFQKREPRYYERLKRLGIIIAANPLLTYHAAGRSFRMNEVMERVRISKLKEPDAWKRAVRDWALYPKDWMEAGLVVTGGSDHGAAPYEPEHPLTGMYSAITGDTLAGVLAPGQELSREAAIRMYTLHNAYATFEESLKGSLEVGKVADLVVLSDDIMTVPAPKVRDIVVEMTMVGGRVVYQRPGSA